MSSSEKGEVPSRPSSSSASSEELEHQFIDPVRFFFCGDKSLELESRSDRREQTSQEA
jgi:hypothetical protein